MSGLEKEREERPQSVSGRYRVVGVTFDDIITCNQGMLECLAAARRLAAVDVALLLHGETGTGKNLLAQAIHNAGPRRRGPFVEVTCGAIPDTLAESELFGHAAGAFTGAVREAKGWFERAHGGTIFLDEIADLPLAIQAKLLRAVERGEFVPVGAGAARHSNARVIVATSRDLDHDVESGRFRQDLFHRLCEVRLEVPPLRSRKDDIPVLVERFLAEWNGKYRRLAGLDPVALNLLLEHDWPGNVRELRAAIRRGAALCHGDWISLRDLDLRVKLVQAAERGGRAEGDLRLATVENRHIARVLRLTGGNKSRAAALLGIARNTLDRKIEEYGLDLSGGVG